MSKIDDYLARSQCANLANDAGCSEALSITRRSNGYPFVLPWRSDRNVHRWYVLSAAETAEVVMEEVWAHIGVSHTDFDGRPKPVGPEDAAYTVVRELWPDAVVARITLTDVGAHEVVAKGVLRLARRWVNPVFAQLDTPRDLQRLLRDHRMALLAGDAGECGSILSELRNRGLLTPLNCLFLEFEQLARFGTPADFLAHPQLGRVLGVRRPAALTDLIAKAIDRAKLRPAGTEDLAAVTSNYQNLDGAHRGLLTALGECRSTSGVLLVALQAVAVGRKLRPQQFAFALDDLTAQALALVTSDVLGNADGGTQEDFRILLNQGNFDDVMAMAEAMPITREKVDAALFAAQQLNSIDSAQRALAILESASSEIRAEVSANRLLDRLVSDLRQLVLQGDSIDLEAISSWVELLSAMIRYPEWDGAVELAEHGASEWGAIDGAALGDTDDSIAKLLRELRSASHPSVDAVSTHLISWFRDLQSQQLAGSMRETGLSLLEHLARSGSTAADVRVGCSLAESLLESEVDVSGVARVLKVLDGRLVEGVPRSAAPGVLDVIAALLVQPRLRSGETDALGVSLLANAALRVDATMPSLRCLAAALADDLGTALELGNLASEESVSATTIAVVGPESTTEQCRSAISRAWPDVRVLECTERGLGVVDQEKLRSAGFVVLPPDPSVDTRAIIEHLGRPAATTVRSASGGPAAHLLEIERWLSTLI